MDFFNFNSVETLPGYEARATFTVNSASVFREDVDIVPTIVDDTLSYVPWGGDNLQLIDRMGDNQMPFKIIEHIEKDEEYMPHLENTGYKPIFSLGNIWFQHREINPSRDSKDVVIQNYYIMDFKALVDDAR